MDQNRDTRKEIPTYVETFNTMEAVFQTSGENGRQFNHLGWE